MIDFKKAARLTVATTMLAVAGMNANAAVVNRSDINGLRTFSDTSTGMVCCMSWLFGTNINAPQATPATRLQTEKDTFQAPTLAAEMCMRR